MKLAFWRCSVVGLLAISATTSADKGPSRPGPPPQCSNYPLLEQAIDADLARWQHAGISQRLMQETIRDHATYAKDPLAAPRGPFRRAAPHSQKGIAVGFLDGRAVLLREPDLSWAGTHVAIWFVFMRALLDLQQQFGRAIPDVEFVISTVDRPLRLATNDSAKPDQPVFRFCKTPAHSDIMIPVFHFFVKGMVSYLLKQKQWLNEHYPWPAKKDVIFARLHAYDRHLHHADPFAQRVGVGGTSICTRAGSTVACSVRQHFVEWTKALGQASDANSTRSAGGRVAAGRDGGAGAGAGGVAKAAARTHAPANLPAVAFDIDMAGRLAMRHHAAFKYLVHLDGQGLSSRLEQLLTLGSVVFKEESGYRGFYHGLLQPYVHYIPFWGPKGPEDILEGLAWAQQHDEEARAIAANAQSFAHRYFTREALSCYWINLLTKFSRLLRYTPGANGQKGGGQRQQQEERGQGQEPQQQQQQHFMTIEEYLETTAKTFDGGRMLALFDYAFGDDASLK